MIANNITFSAKENVRQMMLASFKISTREPRGGEEVYWQRLLTEYDPELHLRFSFCGKRYIIYYDHHGLPEVIRSFAPGESFWCAFKNIKHNGSLSVKQRRDLLDIQRKMEQIKSDKVINDAADEWGKTFDKMFKAKVSTDGVPDGYSQKNKKKKAYPKHSA